MSVETILLAAFFLLCCAGALAAFLVPEHRNPKALAAGASLAALSVLLFAGTVLLSGRVFQVQLWTLPGMGPLTLSASPLPALFILVTGVVFLAASVFSDSYLSHYLGKYSLRSFSVLYHALFASIVLVLVAGDVLTFLFAWEAMSILSYLLVNYEHERDENTRAGWLMLAMGEAGTLAVALALLVLSSAAGSLEFSHLRAGSAGLTSGLRWMVFLLSFFGFGVKGGLAPFNIWLPYAHPAAPANVSAILSGVILNLGIYGIVRVNIDFLPMAMLGTSLVVLIVGSISALIGILYATTENDLKTMLAHSSIENMGIVATGLGAGFVFTATGYAVLAGIAFVAAFYHMINHSIYKALLFLGAGTVDRQAGTREMDRLGGLVKTMPWTSLFFLVGALSISALPPFNGFVSEWLTLQSLLRVVDVHSTVVGVVFAFCGAALALTAGLAITCFVKAFSMTFLGMPRSKEVHLVSEASRSMTIPMGGLAVICLLLGVTPTWTVPVLDGALATITGVHATESLVPPFFTTGASRLPPQFVSEFHDLGAQIGKGLVPASGLVVLHRGGERNPVVFAMSTAYTLGVFVVLLAVVFAVSRLWLLRKRTVVRRPRWDGGVVRLLPEMAYTATGFSSPVRVIFDAVFHPTTVEDAKETIHEHFRTAIRRSHGQVHVLERLLFRPLATAAESLANACARMHNGRLNAYVAYVLVALLVVLVWM
jgi:hydrogenase-4 component B